MHAWKSNFNLLTHKINTIQRERPRHLTVHARLLRYIISKNWIIFVRMKIQLQWFKESTKSMQVWLPWSLNNPGLWSRLQSCIFIISLVMLIFKLGGFDWYHTVHSKSLLITWWRVIFIIRVINVFRPKSSLSWVWRNVRNIWNRNKVVRQICRTSFSTYRTMRNMIIRKDWSWRFFQIFHGNLGHNNIYWVAFRPVSFVASYYCSSTDNKK